MDIGSAYYVTNEEQATRTPDHGEQVGESMTRVEEEIVEDRLFNGVPILSVHPNLHHHRAALRQKLPKLNYLYLQAHRSVVQFVMNLFLFSQLRHTVPH